MGFLHGSLRLFGGVRGSWSEGCFTHGRREGEGDKDTARGGGMGKLRGVKNGMF